MLIQKVSDMRFSLTAIDCSLARGSHCRNVMPAPISNVSRSARGWTGIVIRKTKSLLIISSMLRTPYATRASVRPPVGLGLRDGAHPYPAVPLPARMILVHLAASLRELRARASDPSAGPAGYQPCDGPRVPLRPGVPGR